tara:strand:+ start:4930 stop:5709 length:780 start_codon:yes stop_codon:yes gene_type:complete
MTYELPQRDSPAIVITCEHGGNHIPMTYRALFEARRELLDSHRGYDAGALCMARALAAALAAPLLATTTSRLLADLNRSATHPSVHAAFVRELPRAQRLRIVDRHHRPYRERAERMMREAIARAGRVIHIACHSFTPRLHGRVRSADIGLLYDPARIGEKALCADWKEALAAAAPDLRVRRNYPYLGSNDGLTAWLRTRLGADAYVGIELELNQQCLQTDVAAMHATLAHSLAASTGKAMWTSRRAAVSPAVADTGVHA